MNDAKPKTVFEERDQLRLNYDRVRAAFEKQTIENVELRNKLAATEEALAQVQRESAELRRKYETHCGYWDGPLMRIANAAAKIQDLLMHCTIHGPSDRIRETADELWRVMDEYRALTEPPALSPSKQAVVDRAAAKVEEIGEMWENN